MNISAEYFVQKEIPIFWKNCYNNVDIPFPPKSRQEIYRDLEISRQQAAEGKCQNMEQALLEIRSKYGL